jgi:hypothetical protein
MAKQYRLITPTIARVTSVGHDVAVTIPEGTVITVHEEVATLAAGNTQIEVDLGEKKAVMFAVDVRDRSEEIRTKKAG